MRRGLAVGSAAGALVLATAAPASAHGIGGRLDLPVPIWLFVYGAAAAVIISFVALGALWRQPRLEEDPPGRALPDWMQPFLTGPAPNVVARAVSLALFLLVVVAAGSGDDSSATNLAPVFVFVWFWVGLAFAHALLGNWWATLSPWDTIARALGIGERARVRYPKALGAWPAALLLLGFHGCRITEVPVAMRPRASGKSSTNLVKSMYYPFGNVIAVYSAFAKRAFVRSLAEILTE